MRVVFMNSRLRRRIIGLSTLSPFLWLMGRQEIGMMRAQLESTKFQIIQWLFGVVTGVGALGLGTLLEGMVTDLQLIFDYLVDCIVLISKGYQYSLSNSPPPKLMTRLMLCYTFHSPLEQSPVLALVPAEGKVDIYTRGCP
jgi:hypothetical protein